MYAIQPIEPRPRPLLPWLPRPAEAVAGAAPRVPRLSDWLAGFRELHERARAGQLAPEELTAYRDARAELGKTLLVAQQISYDFGRARRQGIRVAWALQVDLEIGRGQVRAVTVDISSGGFAVLLGAALPRGSELAFEIRLPGGHRVSGTARVINAVEGPAHYRASFAFADVPAGDRDRLELFLFDKILDRLAA